MLHHDVPSLLPGDVATFPVVNAGGDTLPLKIERGRALAMAPRCRPGQGASSQSPGPAPGDGFRRPVSVLMVFQ